jgi:hypothetical protein
MPLHIRDDSPTDFDFIIGKWSVHHERLNDLFAGCTQWTAFSGQSSTVKTLGGFGNLEDNLLRFPDGEARAIAVRSYSPALGTWSIWWLDGRNPGTLGTPVVGRFESGVGTFYADDSLNGSPIRVRFTWFAATTEHPRWEQAFSDDGGATWETNWRMEFVPA